MAKLLARHSRGRGNTLRRESSVVRGARLAQVNERVYLVEFVSFKANDDQPSRLYDTGFPITTSGMTALKVSAMV